jgi:hypothetical protein
MGFRATAATPLRLEYGGPGADFAVAELQRYAGRMLQTKLPWRVVRRDWPDQLYRIRLGAATGGASPVHLESEEFEIAALPGELTFTGDSLSSLLTAVYSWLEEQGCQWLLPGADGEFVPERSELQSPAGRHRSRADLAMRGLFPVENIQRYTAGDVIDTLSWMSRNRFNYLTLLFNYTTARTLPTVIAESRRRGIHLVGYIWSYEMFLPMELGRQHPEYFALVDGKRTVDYNVKRCASSQEAIRLYVENAVKFFRAHPEIRTWNVIPNDGFHWCTCDRCIRIKPKDQWARFFGPLMLRMAREDPGLRLQNFIYVQRFDLPEDLAPYRASTLEHFFDVFWRNKWFTLRDPAMPSAGNQEAEADPRARGMSINRYLADRLHAWRESVPGRIWVFEDLMLHATSSIPVPNIEVMGADLRAAAAEGVQGYQFEAYLQGWNSFASDLWAMGRLTWKTDREPADVERDFYRKLLGAESAPIERFYSHFRAEYMQAVRRCGSLYWMTCRPEAAREYIEAVRTTHAEPLNPAGRAWLARQLRVVEMMERILARRPEKPTSSVFGSGDRGDILTLCQQALETGRAMDGVFLAYEQLRQLFIREFGGDALGFHPNLPAGFSDDVRRLFARQKLWDTLAAWESERKFPRGSDPDAELVRILRLAIIEARPLMARR